MIGFPFVTNQTMKYLAYNNEFPFKLNYGLSRINFLIGLELDIQHRFYNIYEQNLLSLQRAKIEALQKHN